MGPRVTLLAVFIFLLFTGQAFAADRDPTASDLKGIPKSHKYAWAIVGGTAVGAGLGVIAPGGAKSAFKGALIGGSLTSAFYLAKNRRAAEGKRSFAHLVTNTVLGTSVLWTLCDCGEGAWAGALIGGGGTALIQAFGTHRSAIASTVDRSPDTVAQAAAQPIIFASFTVPRSFTVPNRLMLATAGREKGSAVTPQESTQPQLLNGRVSQ